MGEKNSAVAWRAAMAPRQLLLELEEVDMAAEKGPKRVRVDSADDSSMQIVMTDMGTPNFSAVGSAAETPAENAERASGQQARIWHPTHCHLRHYPA
eukprot:scaffold9465_cov130-Isochrysis_galbana.AAC.1